MQGGKNFQYKMKMLLPGGGHFSFAPKQYFTPPTTLFPIRCKMMLGGGGGVKKNVVARGRGSFWGVLPTSPPNQNWNSPKCVKFVPFFARETAIFQYSGLKN